VEVTGQLHDPAVLPSGKDALVTHWLGGWVGPRAGLDAVVKRKIPSLPLPRLEPPIIQLVAERYTTGENNILMDHE
jgi:hypothetical protein